MREAASPAYTQPGPSSRSSARSPSRPSLAGTSARHRRPALQGTDTKSSEPSQRRRHISQRTALQAARLRLRAHQNRRLERLRRVPRENTAQRPTSGPRKPRPPRPARRPARPTPGGPRSRPRSSRTSRAGTSSTRTARARGTARRCPWRAWACGGVSTTSGARRPAYSSLSTRRDIRAGTSPNDVRARRPTTAQS